MDTRTESLLTDSFGRAGPGFDPIPNDPPVAGATQLETERAIVKAVLETYRHEYETRRPMELEWDRAWRRIQNRYDWSGKARWQSKKNFPAILILALQYVWEMTKSLEKASDKWFQAETSDAEWQPLLNVPRDMVRDSIQDTSSPEDSFLLIFYEMMFWGVITGQAFLRNTAEDGGFTDMTSRESSATVSEVMAAAGISAVPSFGFGTVGPTTTPEDPSLAKKGFRIRVEALNPRYCVLDTAGRRKKRYFIHTQTMTRGEFRREGEARGWQYIDEICKMDVHFQAEMDEKTRRQWEANLVKSAARKDQIVLHHCYGEFYDTNGNWVVDEPSYFIIANRRYMTQAVAPLPYWHKMIPVVTGGTLMIPGNPYSKSLLGINLDAQELKVDINNQFADYLNQSINPPTEVDVDQINNVRPNQLAGGMFPGKLLEVQKQGGNMNPAVARSGMPDISSGVWQGWGYLKQEIQEYTGMGGSAAMPKTRNRISMKEATDRAVASAGIIEQICHNIERTVLEPAVHQWWWIILQKMPQEEWAAHIDKHIASLKNRTLTTPPGAGPPQPNVVTPPMQAPPQPGQPPAPPMQQAISPPPPPEYENPGLVEKLKVMRDLAPAERFTQFGSKIRFKVKIYTALESKRALFESLMQMIEIGQGTPQLASRFKWHVIGEELFQCNELDPERYLWPNAGESADTMVPPGAVQPAFKPPELVGLPPQQPIGPVQDKVGGM